MRAGASGPRARGLQQSLQVTLPGEACLGLPDTLNVRPQPLAVWKIIRMQRERVAGSWSSASLWSSEGAGEVEGSACGDRV